MEVHLTRDQEAFARQAITAGRIQHEGQAIQEALALWENRERTRMELLAQLDLAEASLLRGHGRSITQDTMRDLAEDIKSRGRARLAAQPPR